MTVPAMDGGNESLKCAWAGGTTSCCCQIDGESRKGVLESSSKTRAQQQKSVRHPWSLNIARLRGAEDSLLLLSVN